MLHGSCRGEFFTYLRSMRKFDEDTAVSIDLIYKISLWKKHWLDALPKHMQKNTISCLAVSLDIFSLHFSSDSMQPKYCLHSSIYIAGMLFTVIWRYSLHLLLYLIHWQWFVLEGVKHKMFCFWFHRPYLKSDVNNMVHLFVCFILFTVMFCHQKMLTQKVLLYVP